MFGGKVLLKWSKQNDAYDQYVSKRESWISDLEVGRNPFDNATLNALWNE